MDSNTNITLNKIQLLLGSNLRVTMLDGRVAHGKFVSLDRLSNIVLEDVTEYRRVAYVPSPPPGSLAVPLNNGDDGAKSKLTTKDGCYTWDTERKLSQAVIPGDRMVKVEIASREWNERIQK